MVMAVTPSSVTNSRISLFITPDIIGSNPVVGSSKNIIFGSAAIARAKPTRFAYRPIIRRDTYRQPLLATPDAIGNQLGKVQKTYDGDE